MPVIELSYQDLALVLRALNVAAHEGEWRNSENVCYEIETQIEEKLMAAFKQPA
jgi:hypothetical protein